VFPKNPDPARGRETSFHLVRLTRGERDNGVDDRAIHRITPSSARFVGQQESDAHCLLKGPGKGRMDSKVWIHWVQQVLEHHGHQISIQEKQIPQSTGLGAAPHLTHGAMHVTQCLATHQSSREAHAWQSIS